VDHLNLSFNPNQALQFRHTETTLIIEAILELFTDKLNLAPSCEGSRLDQLLREEVQLLHSWKGPIHKNGSLPELRGLKPNVQHRLTLRTILLGQLLHANLYYLGHVTSRLYLHLTPFCFSCSLPAAMNAFKSSIPNPHTLTSWHLAT